MEKLTDEERDLQPLIGPIEREISHEPDAGFEARMWRRLEPQLPASGAATPHAQRPGWWLATAASIAIAAFAAGRYSAPVTAPQPGDAGPPAQRVLLIDLGSHLDLAEMTLVEFETMPVVNATVRARAEDLIDANRLYRATAMTTGDQGVAGVLDELERVLIEIATAPPGDGSGDLTDLRARIGSGGLVLKLRVVRDVLQDRVPAGDLRQEDATL